MECVVLAGNPPPSLLSESRIYKRTSFPALRPVHRLVQYKTPTLWGGPRLTLLLLRRGVTKEYNDQGLTYSVAAEDIHSAFITAFYLLDSNAMAKFYPSGMDGGKDGVWLLVGVRIFSRDRSTVTRGGGVVVSDDLQFREDQWSFVRGPLGKMPVDKTDQQWTLLSIS